MQQKRCRKKNYILLSGIGRMIYPLRRKLHKAILQQNCPKPVFIYYQQRLNHFFIIIAFLVHVHNILILNKASSVLWDGAVTSFYF